MTKLPALLAFADTAEGSEKARKCIACGYDESATVAASWTFTIPRDLPTLNARVFNGRQGWKYRRERDGWHLDMLTMRRVERIPIAVGLRRVTITRLYTGRQKEFDVANIDAKALVDAMQLAGLLVSDAPRCYEGHVKQERGWERGTRIVIEELT